MDDIILIGGGNHCKSVIDVIELEGRFNIVGILEKPEYIGSSVLGYPIIGTDKDLKNFATQFQYALITVGQIGSPKTRVRLFKLAKSFGFNFANVVSPRAYVSNHSNIGDGVIIMHDVIVNAGVNIGDNCIINSKTLIEHDCQIHEHCHISTNVVINGQVTVESESFVGSGSIIRESRIVKKNSIISLGSILS